MTGGPEPIFVKSLNDDQNPIEEATVHNAYAQGDKGICPFPVVKTPNWLGNKLRFNQPLKVSGADS